MKQEIKQEPYFFMVFDNLNILIKITMKTFVLLLNQLHYIIQQSTLKFVVVGAILLQSNKKKVIKIIVN